MYKACTTTQASQSPPHGQRACIQLRQDVQEQWWKCCEEKIIEVPPNKVRQLEKKIGPIILRTVVRAEAQKEQSKPCSDLTQDGGEKETQPLPRRTAIGCDGHCPHLYDGSWCKAVGEREEPLLLGELAIGCDGHCPHLDNGRTALGFLQQSNRSPRGVGLAWQASTHTPIQPPTSLSCTLQQRVGQSFPRSRDGDNPRRGRRYIVTVSDLIRQITSGAGGDSQGIMAMSKVVPSNGRNWSTGCRPSTTALIRNMGKKFGPEIQREICGEVGSISELTPLAELKGSIRIGRESGQLSATDNVNGQAQYENDDILRQGRIGTIVRDGKGNPGLDRPRVHNAHEDGNSGLRSSEILITPCVPRCTSRSERGVSHLDSRIPAWISDRHIEGPEASARCSEGTAWEQDKRARAKVPIQTTSTPSQATFDVPKTEPHKSHRKGSVAECAALVQRARRATAFGCRCCQFTGPFGSEQIREGTRRVHTEKSRRSLRGKLDVAGFQRAEAADGLDVEDGGNAGNRSVCVRGLVRQVTEVASHGQSQMTGVGSNDDPSFHLGRNPSRRREEAQASMNVSVILPIHGKDPSAWGIPNEARSREKGRQRHQAMKWRAQVRKGEVAKSGECGVESTIDARSWWDADKGNRCSAHSTFRERRRRHECNSGTSIRASSTGWLLHSARGALCARTTLRLAVTNRRASVHEEGGSVGWHQRFAHVGDGLAIDAEAAALYESSSMAARSRQRHGRAPPTPGCGSRMVGVHKRRIWNFRLSIWATETRSGRDKPQRVKGATAALDSYTRRNGDSSCERRAHISRTPPRTKRAGRRGVSQSDSRSPHVCTENCKSAATCGEAKGERGARTVDLRLKLSQTSQRPRQHELNGTEPRVAPALNVQNDGGDARELATQNVERGVDPMRAARAETHTTSDVLLKGAWKDDTARLDNSSACDATRNLEVKVLARGASCAALGSNAAEDPRARSLCKAAVAASTKAEDRRGLASRTGGSAATGELTFLCGRKAVAGSLAQHSLRADKYDAKMSAQTGTARGGEAVQQDVPRRCVGKPDPSLPFSGRSLAFGLTPATFSEHFIHMSLSSAARASVVGESNDGTRSLKRRWLFLSGGTAMNVVVSRKDTYIQLQIHWNSRVRNSTAHKCNEQYVVNQSPHNAWGSGRVASPSSTPSAELEDTEGRKAEEAFWAARKLRRRRRGPVTRAGWSHRCNLKGEGKRDQTMTDAVALLERRKERRRQRVPQQTTATEVPDGLSCGRARKWCRP
ncbi:hypothetical protein C8R47DRAFT_1080639 [Mycena vitilis]|nr:hypothetical protein C8R47DRAFT_1080639 [Mycena vitilis]